MSKWWSRHDLFWYYFRCDEESVFFINFCQSSKRQDDFGMDHVGGLPAETDVRRLAFHTNEKVACKGTRRERIYAKRTRQYSCQDVSSAVSSSDRQKQKSFAAFRRTIDNQHHHQQHQRQHQQDQQHDNNDNNHTFLVTKLFGWKARDGN